jgi:hypothetical protein
VNGIVAQVSISPGGLPNHAIEEGRVTTAGIEAMAGGIRNFTARPGARFF